MSKFVEEMRCQPNFYAEKGVSMIQIEQAEEVLEVKFAPDFRECLQEFGAFSIGSHELTGFSMDENLDVVKITQKYREKHNVGKNLYVIEEAHIDGIVVWQDSDGYIYQTDLYSKPEKIANSLKEYIYM